MAQSQLQEEQIPSGGIADFVMSDDEIAALEAEEAREEFGDSGIARFEPIAKRMASYGRYGDDTVAHVETGEILVPRALIDQSPELKESIFNHLRELGVENPERYVVGSSENSINPETGLPEFFFKSIVRGVKKAVSGVAKGVKKAVKSVGKVLKKVAPVVLPIALAMTPLGAIYGAALGSGIGTLIQGGNIKDALKSAVISGAMGGITAGVGSKLSGGTFVGGVKQAAANPLARLSQTGQALGAGNPFQSFSSAPSGSEIADDIAAGRADAGVTEAQELARATDVTPAQQVAADTSTVTAAPDYSPVGKVPGGPDVAPVNDPFFQDAAGNFDSAKYARSRFEGTIMPEGQGYDYRFGGTGGPTPDRVASFAGDAAGTGGTQASFLDTVGDYANKAQNLYSEYLSPSRDMGQISLQDALTDVAANPASAKLSGAAQVELAKEMVAQSTPGLIRSYAPLAGAAGAVAYGSGFFEAPEEEPNPLAEEFQQTGSDLLAQNPDAYMISGRTPQYASGPTTVGTQYGLPSAGGRMFTNPFMRQQMMNSRFMQPQMRAAAGGEVYPRRNGGIMPNEGVPDQDSVRALLMPGEFVMTKDAVKGLGGGSMNQGINNMYSLMRNLESKGQVA